MMRLDLDDRCWLVVDPGPESELADCLCETTLRGFMLQIKGGLMATANPTLFDDRPAAEFEAFGRLTAYRASQAVLDAHRRCSAARIDRVELYDGEGNLVFEADIREKNADDQG